MTGALYRTVQTIHARTQCPPSLQSIFSCYIPLLLDGATCSGTAEMGWEGMGAIALKSQRYHKLIRFKSKLTNICVLFTLPYPPLVFDTLRWPCCSRLVTTTVGKPDTNCQQLVTRFVTLHFREKRKEKEREELWKSLEQLEIDHKMKRNFTPNTTHDNTSTETKENSASKDDSAC